VRGEKGGGAEYGKQKEQQCNRIFNVGAYGLIRGIFGVGHRDETVLSVPANHLGEVEPVSGAPTQGGTTRQGGMFVWMGGGGGQEGRN